jgi:hypothetical protein
MCATASLVHPSFAGGALKRLVRHGIVLKICVNDDTTRWLQECKSLKAIGKPFPLVHTIRILARSEREVGSIRAEREFEISRVTDGRQRLFCDTVELHENAIKGMGHKLLVNSRYSDHNIKYLTHLLPSSIDLCNSSVQELTLIHVRYAGNFTYLFRYDLLEYAFIFYIDDESHVEYRSVTPGIISELTSRYSKAPPGTDVPIEDIIDAPPNAKILFIAVDNRKRPMDYDIKAIKTGQYDDRFFFLHYFDPDWDDK